MRIPVRTSDPERQPVEMRVLRVGDRCERCGAEAFVLVVVAGIDMHFCGHHFARHETRLRAVAEAVLDERGWINRSPSQS